MDKNKLNYIAPSMTEHALRAKQIICGSNDNAPATLWGGETYDL